MDEKKVEQAKVIMKKYLLDTYPDRITEAKVNEILNGIPVVFKELGTVIGRTIS